MILMKDPSLFQQQAFIDGEFCDADGGGTVTVTNPASGAVLGTVPDGRRNRRRPGPPCCASGTT
jgi:succinate-semialdehyde dehydrogenase/glutarate-semialdehyde dehydrogenase